VKEKRPGHVGAFISSTTCTQRRVESPPITTTDGKAGPGLAPVRLSPNQTDGERHDIHVSQHHLSPSAPTPNP